MDLEKNVLDIENEDGVLDINEENNNQIGDEIFNDPGERFHIDEENDLGLEENDLTSKKKKNEGHVNDSSSKNTSLSMSFSIPSIVVSLVASVAIIGTTAGIIPSSHSTHVSMFLSRSTELGFEIGKENEKTYQLLLTNEQYEVSEEVTLRNQFVFTDLMPNTTYNLDVYDISVEPSKKVYSANYLTKSHDDYYAMITNSSISDSYYTFNASYRGNNIDYVTVEVLGDNSKTLLLYEGAPKETFRFYIGENSNVTCHISINGKATHFEQLLNPDKSTPSIPWSYDENNHWHEIDGEIVDSEPHSLIEEILVEPTFESVGSARHICSICDYESEEYELPIKEHSYSNEWSYDETYHWHACVDKGYEDLIKDKTEHNHVETSRTEATYDNTGLITYTCECGHVTTEEIPQLVHNYSDEWSHDETQHWHACTDEGYEDEKGDLDYHSFDVHGACVCGYSAFTFELDSTETAYKITGRDTSASFNYQTVEFPETYNGKPVVEIPAKIFEYGGAINVTVPNSYTYLNDGTFYGCIDMETIVLPFVGSSQEQSDVNPESFFGWIYGTKGYGGSLPGYWVDMTSNGGAKTLIPQALKSITINGGKLLAHSMRGLIYVETITLNGVSEIGDYAFADYNTQNKIQSITIGNSIGFIGSNVFNNNPLTELTFLGTTAEWEGLDKEDDWNAGSSLTKVVCSDGEIAL